MLDRDPPLALTFDDVLLQPGFSDVLPRETQLETRLARDIMLRIPLLSSAMDTVTEARLAIRLAELGGIGVIHRNLPVETQAEEVGKVKRYESVVINDPITIRSEMRLEDAIILAHKTGVSCFPVVDEGRLSGLLTHRDMRAEDDKKKLVREVMSTQLITANEGVTPEAARRLIAVEEAVERIRVRIVDGEVAIVVHVDDAEDVLRILRPLAVHFFIARRDIGIVLEEDVELDGVDVAADALDDLIAPEDAVGRLQVGGFPGRRVAAEASGQQNR